VTVFTRYATVLRGHGTAVPLTASIVGRLSLGMTSLALLLLVRDTSGSYAVAGLVSGGYALSFGVLGPALARLADRTGPVPALRITAVLHPALLAVVVAAARSELPLPVLLLPTVLAGATVPPLGPVMRALWAHVLRGPSLATAYSLESVVVELCFVLGPLPRRLADGRPRPVGTGAGLRGPGRGRRPVAVADDPRARRLAPRRAARQPVRAAVVARPSGPCC
jgi:MFS family permease